MIVRRDAATPTAVPALLLSPPNAWALLVLAHGAGAGMRHRGLETPARALAARGVATLRYEFPYLAVGGRRPDPPPRLHATVRAAVAEAARLAPELPRFAGGRSMGGRMTSQADAKRPLDGVAGLVFLAFPLHPPKRPATERAEHLREVEKPMLFLNGTRDALADLELLRGVCADLGPRATLHVVAGGDHSFAVLRRSGRSAAEVDAEIADAAVAWMRRVLAGAAT
ncbi:MAG TPA: alpha/beta family hydrolase [Thermoanaerobaculia bacterium]|nr:alpha/beta family hydrolase [Thermoanaerobaculia bacterium]